MAKVERARLQRMRFAGIVALGVALGVALEARARADSGPASAAVELAPLVRARAAQLQRVGDYEQAAQLWERWVRLVPNGEHADDALADATILRLGLGQPELAEKDASDFIRLFGATQSRKAAAVALALALGHVEHERWARALDVLGQHQRLLEIAPIDLRIQAHLARAQALLHGATPALAYADLTAARALYGDGAHLESDIAKAWPDESESQHLRRVAKSLNAVGDALFLLTERERALRIGALPPPRFTGPRSQAAIDAHLRTKVAPWMQRRSEAITALETQYRELLDLRPVPPPRAVIAAAGAVALLWADYADDLARVVPQEAYPRALPPGAPPDSPTRATVLAAIKEVRAPILERHVKPAMRTCLSLSVKYQYQDTHARACEAWLVANAPDEFHRESELQPAPRAARMLWVEEPPHARVR